ncbi:MAG TPA: class I SAM-dependent methyltransferase, partial [Cyclobacteriaceae bacterium]|nr:class I SAM-dependent methyltransferase [Cyclobacteriaceae bacterium]
MENIPVLQNRMFSTIAEAIESPTGDVFLVQDMQTGLIFNSAFDPNKFKYDQNYQNEQACSSVFQSHLDSVATIIDKYFQGHSLIEVGCGKAYFLEYLQAKGFSVIGIDPTYEGNNPTVIKTHFERGLGLTADGIVLRHVLEHVPDPVSFLSNIAETNGGKGNIYIEVPCFDWICRRRAWFDI